VVTSPVRQQTNFVRKAFRDAGYIFSAPTDGLPHPQVMSCHSSRVDIHGVPCVQTYVMAVNVGPFWKSPTALLEQEAQTGLTAWRHGTADEMLKALGRLNYHQLVKEIEGGKYELTLPVPDAQLPERLWAATDTTEVETRHGLITVAEAAAGWTITAQHKTLTHKGAPQTYRVRIRRCGCTSVRRCHCVLKPRPILQLGENACSGMSSVCHQAGHTDAINAYVKYIARTYA
jgi:hypothetical protein